MSRNPKSVLIRLWKKTSIDPITGCWLFSGSKSWQGYGWIGIFREGLKHKTEKVHRVSASLYLGYDLLDKTIQVNHIRECPNRNCWNPEHLYLGNQWQNVCDAVDLGKHHRKKE